MKGKNVLEVINLFGSAKNFIGGQFLYLGNHGCNMHLICSYSPELKEFAKEQNIKYKAVRLERQISIWNDIKAYFIICRYIKNNKIDTVIAHQCKARLIAMLAATTMRVPNRIIFAHGILYETMHGFKRWLIRENDRFVSKLSMRVVCVSNYVKNKRLEDKIDKPSKQLLLHCGSCNGIDAIHKFNPALYDDTKIEELKSIYSITNDDFIIGFVGRLVRDKGVVELIDGFQLIKAKYPNKKVKLLVVGNPEVRDALPADTLNIINNSKDIIYTGPVPYEDIAAYYLLMNVFILPSHRDGLGLVALEAAAMERPSIVSAVTGCRETIIPDKTGSYVELTGESICNTIEKYFNPELLRSHGQNARQFVLESFERSIVNKAMLDFLNNLSTNEQQ